MRHNNILLVHIIPGIQGNRILIYTYNITHGHTDSSTITIVVISRTYISHVSILHTRCMYRSILYARRYIRIHGSQALVRIVRF